MKKLLLPALLILISLSGFSRSTKGKEFWVGFMENLTLAANGPPSFKLHISSDVSTTCSVSIPYTGFTSTFNVVANQVYVFDMPTGNFNPFGDEAFANNGIRITSNDSVEVKAFHHRVFFTESTLVLPLEEIGTDYLVTAQPDGSANSPDEFMVLATQNNTTIQIIPSAVTVGTRPIGVAFTATLQRGQMYQLQAYGDLTGTSVKSLDTTKKIAVFGGARQAQFGCAFAADDHLYDQLYPISSFGTSYHIVPFLGQLFTVIKVVASQNSTTVSVTNGNAYALNAGQFVTFTVNTSCEITSKLPVSVSQLAISGGCTSAYNASGDPGMITLVPSDLFQTKAFFYTPSTVMLGSTPDYFNKHHVNIVIKTSAIGNLTLDNIAIPAISFVPVSPNSNYSYTQVTLDTLTLLQHVLRCDSGFNATVYALPFLNFYGHHLGYNNPGKTGTHPTNPTGLQSNRINSSLMAFPIPAAQTLTLKASKQIGSIRVTDIFGKDVLSMRNLGSNQVHVNISALADGIYYCMIEYEDINTTTEVVKFVKTAKE